jgi:hypothetical protein
MREIYFFFKEKVAKRTAIFCAFRAKNPLSLQLCFSERRMIFFKPGYN